MKMTHDHMIEEDRDAATQAAWDFANAMTAWRTAADRMDRSKMFLVGLDRRGHPDHLMDAFRKSVVNDAAEADAAFERMREVWHRLNDARPSMA